MHIRVVAVFRPCVGLFFIRVSFCGSGETPAIVNYNTVQYNTIHYTTLHYTTLHYTTLHYTTLHYTTLHYTTLHYTTLHYKTIQDKTRQDKTRQMTFWIFGFRFWGCFGLRIMGDWEAWAFCPGGCGFWDLGTGALVISDCKCVVCL